MEHYILCNSCGKGFVYTDEDIQKNKGNAAINLLSAVGQVSSALSGNQVGYIANKMNEKELRSFDKCPHCGSTDLRRVSKDTFQQAHKSTASVSTPSISINTNASISSLIKRTVMLLEDQEWEKAEVYCDQILDADPENAQVYLLLALIESKVSSPNELVKKGIDLRNSKYYKSIMRFGSDRFKSSISEINKRFDAKQIERAQKAETEADLRIEKRYLQAVDNTNSNDIKVLRETVSVLSAIGDDYKDASLYIEKCSRKIKKIEKSKIHAKIVVSIIAILSIISLIVLAVIFIR